jgi:hypothetical protein
VAVEIDNGGEIDGGGEIAFEDSPVFRVCALLFSFPISFSKFHYIYGGRIRKPRAPDRF